MATPRSAAVRGTSTWASFISAYVLVLDFMEDSFRKEGLPPLTWYDVLWLLDASPNGRMRMHELAERAVYSRSFISRIVTTLEAEGLVVREVDETDGRGRVAVLTEQGRALRRKMWPPYQRLIHEMFNEHMTASELESMERGLRRVIAGAHQRNQDLRSAAAQPAAEPRTTRKRSRSRSTTQRSGA
jgi:DNA-binding MarR family transcriptional regulator